MNSDRRLLLVLLVVVAQAVALFALATSTRKAAQQGKACDCAARYECKMVER